MRASFRLLVLASPTFRRSATASDAPRRALAAPPTSPRRGPRRLALAAALAATTLAAPAFAQQDVAQARVAFERGFAALDEGRFRDAIEALERSRAIRDVPVVEYNLGLAYRGVGQNLEAIEAFERYLAHPDPHATPAEIAAVRNAVASLRATLASLAVRPTPADATVRVDGSALETATEATPVNPGRHAVEVLAEGYRPELRTLELAAGQRVALAVALQSLGGPARLVVVPSVADAVVTIDGERQPLGLVSRVMPPGEHLVSIHASGYERFERTVVLGQTGVVRVEARLARAAGVPWWVPVGIGAGVAVVGGAVLAGVLLAQPRQGDLTLLPHTNHLVYEQ